MSNSLMTQVVQRISQAADPKDGIWKQLETAVDDFELFDDDVLIATYIRPEKTKGGILLTTKNLEEDRFQGKAALVLKKGPAAFKYDRSGQYPFEGKTPEVNDWVVFRASEAWEVGIKGVSCRIIRSIFIRGSIADPTVIW